MTIEEKYEPKHFKELVFADKNVQNTCAQYVQGKPHKSLMLWGPPGTAKTTTARVIAGERFAAAGYTGDIEEFNAAQLSTADFEKLLNVASMLRFACDDPVIIINEFDEFDKEDQAKFRAWMDQYTWITLIVTTNEQPGVQGVRQKLTPAIQSRFQRVELAPPSLQDWLPRAQFIFQQEGHIVSQADLKILLSSYSGDVRDVLPLIETALSKM